MAATWRVGVGKEPSIPHPATHAIVPKQSHLPYNLNLEIDINKECGWDLAESLQERLTVNAKVATVLGLMPASSVTVKSEGRQMKQCGITYIKKFNKYKKSPYNKMTVKNSLQSPTHTRRVFMIQ